MQKDKREALRARVAAIKPKLKKNWKGRFITLYPEYDNLYSIGLLANVIALRSSDQDITEKLEGLANES